MDKSLDNIVTLFSGNAWKSASFKQIGKMPIIRIQNIGDNKSKEFIYWDEEYNDNFIVNKGDLLLSLSGSIKLDFWDGEPALLNQRIVKIIPKKGIDTHWLFFQLKNYIRKITNMGNHALVNNVSLTDLKKLNLKVPEYETQLYIANLLSKAENLIALRKESIRLLEEFLKSTFLDMFGDPVRNEKGWETRTIEQLVKKEKYALKRGPFGGALKKEIFVPSGYLVYEQFHALNNDFTFARYFIDEAKFEELKGFEVKPGDIIVSCSGVYLGKLAIVPEGAKQGIINQALLKISLDNRIIENVFFVYVFSNENFKRKFYGNIIGTGIPNFPSMDDFKKFNFIYPPIELQTLFAQIVEKIETLKSKYQQSLQELENLYGSLSQKAFRGELNK